MRIIQLSKQHIDFSTIKWLFKYGDSLSAKPKAVYYKLMTAYFDYIIAIHKARKPTRHTKSKRLCLPFTLTKCHREAVRASDKRLKCGVRKFNKALRSLKRCIKTV